jgi:hypothetical protein
MSIEPKIWLAALGMTAACGLPQTRMVPAAEYQAAGKPTISAAPSFTAGPTEVRTYSPDGSTVFICADGRTLPADRVQPGGKPAC